MLIYENGCFHGELDRGPQQVEINEMENFPIEISAPIAVDHLRQKQAGDQEEIRHAKWLGEGDDRMQPAFLYGGLSDAERGMHHHDENDAKSLGVVDPVDALACRCITSGMHGSGTGLQLAPIPRKELHSALRTSRMTLDWLIQR